MDDAVDVARLVDARLGSVARVPISHLAIRAGEARLPYVRAGNDAVDGILQAGKPRLARLHKGRAAVTGVRMVVVRGAVARLAEMAPHRAERHEQLRDVLRPVAARSREVVEHPHVAGFADLAREIRDLFHRNAADVRRPLSCFRLAVVDALHVIAEVHVLLEVIGLVVGVEAHRVLVEEVPVDDVAFLFVEAKHLGGHAQHERRVRAGADGNPVRVEHLRGSRVDGIDRDELDPRLLGAKVMVARRARSRPSGIRRVEHDGVGVEHVGAVVAGARIGAGDADGGVRVQQVRAVRRRVGDGRMAPVGQKRRERVARAIAAEEERLVAVLFLDGLELAGDVVDGLVPADALPFVLAAQLSVGVLGRPALALHGVLQAVRAEALLLLGLAAHAAALLRVVRAVLVRVVRLLTNDRAVLHHHLVHAAPAAVVPARGSHPCAAVGRIGGQLVLVSGVEARFRGAPRRRQGGSARRHRGGGPEKAATRYVLRFDAHDIPPCFPRPPCRLRRTRSARCPRRRSPRRRWRRRRRACSRSSARAPRAPQRRSAR